MFRYRINNLGVIISYGYDDPMFGDELKGDEPFNGLECNNYRFDFETNSWVYDPVLIQTENTVEL